MRILIDIGHPAHVHYFKNFVWIMRRKGHEFRFVARDKEMTFDLLRTYGFDFHSRGKGGRGLLGKLIYLLIGDWRLLRAAISFKPDLFLSFASSYAAHASWIYRKPHVALDDTEHSKLELLLYPPFTTYILTPSFFTLDLGSKHHRFNAFMEQFYLNPSYYEPDQSILRDLRVAVGEPFVIVRFVSWGASHDVAVGRLSAEEKSEIIHHLKKKIRVFISSEEELPEPLKKNEMDISKERIHDALAFASLYVGEGATTASESVMLGTPAIYLNPLGAGTIAREEASGLLVQSTIVSEVLRAIDRMLDTPKQDIEERHTNLLEGTIDPTEFLVKFIEDLGEHPSR